MIKSPVFHFVTPQTQGLKTMANSGLLGSEDFSPSKRTLQEVLPGKPLPWAEGGEVLKSQSVESGSTSENPHLWLESKLSPVASGGTRDEGQGRGQADFCKASASPAWLRPGL